MKNAVFVLLCFFAGGMVYGQDFITYEYSFNGGNLRSALIQQKDDGNYIITTQKDCYTPGSITIEGCPIARHIFEIDYSGNVIWSSDLFLSHNSAPEKMIENPNGDLELLTSQPINYDCGMISVGFFGFYRLSRYHLSSFGEMIDTIILNSECGLGLIDLVRLSNNDIQMLAIPDSFDINNNTHYLELDQELNVFVDKVLPSTEVKYYSLIRTETQKTFASQVNQLKDSLNLVLIDSGGEITQAMPITDSDKIRIVQMKNLNNSDLLLGVLRKSFSSQDQVFEIIRVTQQGEVLWSELFPDVINAILIENPDGTIYFITSEYNMTSGSLDVLVKLLGPSGETLTSKYYEISEDDEVPVDAIIDTEGNLVVLGNTNCCNRDSTTGPGKIFVLLDSTGLSVGSVQAKKDRPFSVYPNPANNIIYFASNGIYREFQFNIYDNMGRLVLKGVFHDQRQIDVSDLPTGSYIVCVQSDKGEFFSEKFTKR